MAKKISKNIRIGIIVISILLIILLGCLALCLQVISSKANINKQHGGIPNSEQIYEYYSFSEQSSMLYNKLLSSKYNYSGDESDYEIDNVSYMVLCIDNQLVALPDNYLYSNYSSFNVKCDVTENDYHYLKLRFSGSGISIDNQKKNIDFFVIVDWNKVFLHTDDYVCISVAND